MRREILFRGKHIHVADENKHHNGKWIYGYLSDENYIYSKELQGEFLVDPKTVCQYTGLKDKNGNKIFENDIIKYTNMITLREVIEQIAYNEEAAGFMRLCNSEFGVYYGHFNKFVANKCEVIGNIFDDYELKG